MAGKKKGRPAWIPTPEILRDVEAAASRFLKEEQIAVIVGIAPQTFSDKKKHFPELSEAIQRGRAKVSINISNKLYEQAMAGNSSILIFLAKSVIGLRENDPTIREHVTFNVITSKGTEQLRFSDA